MNVWKMEPGPSENVCPFCQCPMMVLGYMPNPFVIGETILEPTSSEDGYVMSGCPRHGVWYYPFTDRQGWSFRDWEASKIKLKESGWL